MRWTRNKLLARGQGVNSMTIKILLFITILLSSQLVFSIQSNQNFILETETRISKIEIEIAERKSLIKNLDVSSKDYAFQKKLVASLKNEKNILSKRIELFESLEDKGLIMYSQPSK